MFRIVKWSLFFIVLGVSGVILNSSSPKISIEVADIRFESTLFILIAVLLLAIGVLYILVSGLYKFFLLSLVTIILTFVFIKNQKFFDIELN